MQKLLHKIYVILSHLRSKEIIGMPKPCIPHFNDSSATTEYILVYIQMFLGNVVDMRCSLHFDFRL